MKIAILGFNVEGKASYGYYKGQGHEITICDRSSDIELPEGVGSKLGEDYLENLDEFDLLVRSPGIYPQTILDKNPNVKDKITTQTNEFFKVCPTKNIIGITGTKGKGTTSSLITKMLEATGKQAYLGGNIGVPMISMLSNIGEDDWVVLELSNFQLIDIQYAPHIAVCLTVVSEHIDWHPNAEDYFASKANLFAHQSSDDIAIYFDDNETTKQIVSKGSGHLIPYYKQPGAVVENGNFMIDGKVICRTEELSLLGKHNWQNVCAAITAVWQVSQDVDAFHEAITNFVTLEHRLEFVRELDGVKYFNDSFGTTPETAIVAIESFEEPIVLIVGGSEKGSDYNDLVGTILGSTVAHVVCIGVTGLKIADMLEARKDERCVTYSVWESYDNVTIDEVVTKAREVAEPGSVVLLSCASASFDMFKNYKDRGEKFKRAVQALV